jgi:hypothetical protein
MPSMNAIGSLMTFFSWARESGLKFECYLSLLFYRRNYRGALPSKQMALEKIIIDYKGISWSTPFSLEPWEFGKYQHVVVVHTRHRAFINSVLDAVFRWVRSWARSAI